MQSSSEEVSLLGVVPPGEDAIGQFIIALLDAEGAVAEVNEDNNEVVSQAIVGEGSEGGNGGCATLAGSIPPGMSIANFLVLIIPLFVIGLRALMNRRGKVN